MNSVSRSLQDQISELLKPHRVCLVTPVVWNQGQSCGRSGGRFMVLSLWRGYLVVNKQTVRCVQVESSFSYLDICSINIHSQTQVVLETDRQTFSLSVLHAEDLEAMVSHMTASLKRIFPDSSPGKLLKTIPAELQQRLLRLTAVMEQQLNSQTGPCGGFSDTYAALCDFNEMPFREEVQWDIDNIYFIHKWKQFNFHDFSHLESRDLALAIAALSYNQWFTKIYSKELKLPTDVQEQLSFLLSSSPSLTELHLEACGLKMDFAVKLAEALRDHTSSNLRSVNLSGNPVEDKGVIALSQQLGNLTEGLKNISLSRVAMTSRGLSCLSQKLLSSQVYSSSLTHLDLSGNTNCLLSEEATFLFKFLSNPNCLSHLDLSETNCPLDTLFVSLTSGCCEKMTHLNLTRNPFSHRKVRGVTRSVREFFSQSCELKFVGLSETKLPPQALRLLLQGLATNAHLSELELDLSSCELHSAGAQVIQEHISEATAIKSLDISDNGLENDMVTLVLSLGRCRFLQHLALGRNFTMKSRALTDVLHRIAQLIQDEECSLRSLSVCDSKLKSGIHILLSALGGHAALAQLDISGNNMGDTGAKMMAKALVNNTRLRSLRWDRNNITARGYQDVADALERNFTLQQVSLPLTDITNSYRSNPDRTREALHKIQQCLDRNNQRQFDREELHRVFRTQQSEKLVQGMCRQLEDSLQEIKQCSLQQIQEDFLTAHEVLHNSREAVKLLPSLYQAGTTSSSDRDMVNSTLGDTAAVLTNDFTQSIQEMAQGLMRSAESVCPRVVQRSSVWECLSECVSRRSRQTQEFLRNTLVEKTGEIITNRLSELRESLSVSLAESIIEQSLQDLTATQDKMNCFIKENSCSAPTLRVPELCLTDSEFPTDEYTPAFWRNSFHSKSMRPASSIKSLLDADWDRGAEGSRGGEEGGGDERCDLPRLPSAATPLSVTARSPTPSPSTSPSPSPPGWRRGRRRKEEGVAAAAVDAAAAISGVRSASFIPPPDPPPPCLPLLGSISTPALEEEAAGHRGSNRPRGPFPGYGRSSPGPLPNSGPPASPMEPLPTQGQTLRHYTASRPRPRRTHTQPPSTRPQEPAVKVENEASEGMGRVDEGVEEFFTKKILPDYALKGQWEESNPAQAETPPEPSSTPFSSSSENITSSVTTTVTSPTVPHTDTSFPSNDVPPLSTSSTPPLPSSSTTIPTKNIKKKFGEFFAFKRARAGRATKAGGGEGGGGEGVKVKRTSIADLIRPLREAKERERERERDKEREKERGTRSVEDANVSNDATTTEGTQAQVMAPASTLATTSPPSEGTPSFPATAPAPDHVVEGGAPGSPGQTPSSGATPAVNEPERSRLLMKDMKQGGERRLKVKRSLREGKSQSLILLTGLEPEDKESPHSQKHASESSSSFEQRLQVMLHRMGVAKTPPADAKACSKDEELRKANSEGAILDKPKPPPTFMKPRTMSTSSADPRHPIKALDTIRPEPPLPLHPKPAIPERPVGPLLPKPLIAAKPALSVLGAPVGGAACQFFAPPPSSPAERVQFRAHIQDGRTGESTAQKAIQDGPQSAVVSPRKEQLPPALSPWRRPSGQDRCEKAQSVTDESLPKPQPHLKPLPQRRAVSVHEDTLAMTQELKAVLQRSPIRFKGNRVDLPPCTEHPCSGEDVQKAQEVSDTGAAKDKDCSVHQGEIKTGKCSGTTAKTREEGDAPLSRCQLMSPTQTMEKSSTFPASDQTPEKLLQSSSVSATIPAPTESQPVVPRVSPMLHTKKSPGPSPSSLVLGNSTQEGGETAPEEHTTEDESTEQRTEPRLSE